MVNIIVTGIGTHVGKTIASAILIEALEGSYWKPIQCGNLEHSDSKIIESLTGCSCFPSSYELIHPVSPHHSARLEEKTLDLQKIILPNVDRPLIIETAGGLFVPLTPSELMIDHFEKWNCLWIVVSRHYLGSINHTLLTLEALQRRGITPYLIFNGNPNPDTEKAISHFSEAPILGRIFQEKTFNPGKIKEYAEIWEKQTQFGTLIPK